MSTTPTAVEGRADARKDAAIPNGYERSNIGVIPNDWEVKQLGNIAILQRGRFSARPRNDPKFFGGDIPFIQTGDVSNSNGRIRTFSQTLNGRGLRVSKVFPSNTIFFTIAANIGDVGIAEFSTACPDSLIAITPRSKIHKNWLFHTLKSQKKVFEGLATQNAQLNINLEKLRPYLVAVPTGAEQRAIAVLLSDVDELISALDKLIAKKRAIKLATMQQLLTGKTRLPGFGRVGQPYKQTEIGSIPDDWDVKPLQDDVLLVSGHHVFAEDCNLEGKGIPYITGPADFPSGVIRHTKFTERPSALCRASDILVTVKGSGAGTIVLSNGEYCISRQLMAIRVSSWDSRYVYYSLLNRSSQMELAATGLIPGLSRSDILRERLAIPALPEQQTIAAVLSDMEAEVTALERRRDKAKSIKIGMMQTLLTGRIRLVKPEVVSP
jgi:type I restriction enzyme S subunit